MNVNDAKNVMSMRFSSRGQPKTPCRGYSRHISLLPPEPEDGSNRELMMGQGSRRCQRRSSRQPKSFQQDPHRPCASSRGSQMSGWAPCRPTLSCWRGPEWEVCSSRKQSCGPMWGLLWEQGSGKEERCRVVSQLFSHKLHVRAGRKISSTCCPEWLTGVSLQDVDQGFVSFDSLELLQCWLEVLDGTRQCVDGLGANIWLRIGQQANDGLDTTLLQELFGM